MKKLSYLAALVVAMTAVSCVQDMNEGAPVNNGATTFTASFDAAAASKAVLKPGETESKVEWEAGDQVSVLAGAANYLYTANAAGATTTLTTEATNVPTEGTFYAVYPYNADATVVPATEAETPDSISTVLPAQQTAVNGSFATHLAVAKAADNKFAFKNVCALVKVNIAADGVTKIVFEGNNSEVVAGGINVAVADAPAWKAVVDQGATSVTLASASALEAGDYFFAVLPQTFAKGFKVTAYKGEQSWVVRNVTASTTLERAGIVGGKSFFEIEGNGTEANPYILKTPEHLVGMRSLATYGGETWFKMENDIDMQGVTNYVPVNCDNLFDRKIHFDGNNKTISNFTCTKREGMNYPSLFGVLYGTCKDLKVDKATITSNSSCGVIAGYVGTEQNLDGVDGAEILHGEVSNVTVTNSSVTGSGDRPGGICGQAMHATFANVSYQGSVTSTYTSNAALCGGFVGQVSKSATFTDCSSDVTVTAKSNDAAGFVGKINEVASFVRCNAKAVVSSSAAEKHRCAGFAGWVNGTVTFNDCHVLEGSSVTDASGSTTKHLAFVGGFISYAGGTTTTVTGCSAKVTLSAPYGQYVGGFVAIAGTGKLLVDGSSSTGVIEGNECTAGFIGGQEAAAVVDIKSSSSSVKVTAKGNYSGGFAGKMANNTGVDNCVKFTDCHATGNVTSTSASSGFVGYILYDADLTRCYATGTITSTGSNLGGVLGYVGETDKGGALKLTDCYYTGAITSSGGTFGGVVGFMQPMSTITMKGCYATAPITSTNNGGYIGGLAGSLKGKATIEDCHATGNIVAKNQNNGGLVAALFVDSQISRCYATGNIDGGTVNKCAGLVGYIGAGKFVIENCYTTGNVVGTGMTNGGIVGQVAAGKAETSIVNCYATGNVSGKGAGGILGNSRGTEYTTVQGCIAWNPKVETTNRGETNYAPAAIVGSSYFQGTYKDCYRRSDMILTDNIAKSYLYDQSNVENGVLPLIEGTTGEYNQAYHGKAAAADATISSVATTLGWSTDVWDLSKDVPVLK